MLFRSAPLSYLPRVRIPPLFWNRIMLSTQGCSSSPLVSIWQNAYERATLFHRLMALVVPMQKRSGAGGGIDLPRLGIILHCLPVNFNPCGNAGSISSDQRIAGGHRCSSGPAYSKPFASGTRGACECVRIVILVPFMFPRME